MGAHPAFLTKHMDTERSPGRPRCADTVIGGDLGAGALCQSGGCRPIRSRPIDVEADGAEYVIERILDRRIQPIMIPNALIDVEVRPENITTTPRKGTVPHVGLRASNLPAQISSGRSHAMPSLDPSTTKRVSELQPFRVDCSVFSRTTFPTSRSTSFM